MDKSGMILYEPALLAQINYDYDYRIKEEELRLKIIELIEYKNLQHKFPNPDSVPALVTTHSKPYIVKGMNKAFTETLGWDIYTLGGKDILEIRQKELTKKYKMIINYALSESDKKKYLVKHDFQIFDIKIKNHEFKLALSTNVVRFNEE